MNSLASFKLPCNFITLRLVRNFAFYFIVHICLFYWKITIPPQKKNTKISE